MLQFAICLAPPITVAGESLTSCTGELSEEALTEVLIFLLGPVRRTEESPWEETILGLQKHVLLKEVLRELSRHRTMQRLVTQYREMLDEAGKSPP